MFLYIVFLIVGFALLVAGAELLVRGASSIAKNFKIPEYAIGATIVAFGTSTPELATSVFASYLGKSDIAVANVVGSNIFNVALIIGIAALLNPIKLKRHVFEKDATQFIFSAIILIIISANLIISRVEGIVLVILLAAYTLWLLLERDDGTEVDGIELLSPYISSLMIIIGLVLLVAGSKFSVENAVKIAELLKMPQWIIGVTIVAAGTSLPELVTSAIAAIRHKPEIAVGNVIGSNIFNIYMVLGVSSIVNKLPISKTAATFDIPMNLFLSLGLMFMIYDKKIPREAGFILVAVYMLLVISIIQIH